MFVLQWATSVVNLIKRAKINNFNTCICFFYINTVFSELFQLIRFITFFFSAFHNKGRKMCRLQPSAVQYIPSCTSLSPNKRNSCRLHTSFTSNNELYNITEVRRKRLLLLSSRACCEFTSAECICVSVCVCRTGPLRARGLQASAEKLLELPQSHVSDNSMRHPLRGPPHRWCLCTINKNATHHFVSQLNFYYWEQVQIVHRITVYIWSTSFKPRKFVFFFLSSSTESIIVCYFGVEAVMDSCVIRWTWQNVQMNKECASDTWTTGLITSSLTQFH